MDDRRNNQRRRTIKAAKATFGDFRFTYDCVVRNITDGGAQLRCDFAHEIPDEFYFFDPSEQSLQKAEVRWRKDRDFGIMFTGTPVNVHQSPDQRHARFRFL